MAERTKAPGCVGCHHLLVAHGAGKCWAPGCDCPSTAELWDKSLNAEPSDPGVVGGDG